MFRDKQRKIKDLRANILYDYMNQLVVAESYKADYILPVKQFRVEYNAFNCFYDNHTKKILTYDYIKKKSLLLDTELNVTHYSDFTSLCQLATVEMNKKLLYTVWDGINDCLVYVKKFIYFVNNLIIIFSYQTYMCQWINVQAYAYVKLMKIMLYLDKMMEV